MKKILLVTADKDLVTMINNALTHYDVDVTVESNYNEAIETVQRENFDLLISDYFLHANGDDEAFNSFSMEIDTLDNDMRLLTPMKDNLVRLRQFIHEKSEEKLFPLGNRLSAEAELFGTDTALLLSLDDPKVDKYDMRDYIEDIATYYCKYGRHVYYYPYHFPKAAVNKFVKEDVIDAMKIRRIY